MHNPARPAKTGPSRAARAAAMIGLAAALSACGDGGIRGVFGVQLDPPNAFNVLPNKPLRLPTDLAHLPEPTPGAPSPLEARPDQEARAALSARRDGASGAPSAGELALLDAAGSEGAEAGIRATLAEESAQFVDDPGPVARAFGFEPTEGRVQDVLDQSEETRRLREEGKRTPTAPPQPPKDASNEYTFGAF